MVPRTLDFLVLGLDYFFFENRSSVKRSEPFSRKTYLKMGKVYITLAKAE